MKDLSILRVGVSESGVTLHEFISRRLGISGKKAKSCIDSRRVFVNGRRVWMARHKLSRGDEVFPGLDRASRRRDDSCTSRQTPRITHAMILFRDDRYLILNKPPGIATDGPGGLESRLRSFLARNAGADDGSPDNTAAVHRLDKDTSGCVIFARDTEAKDLMIPLFAGRSITKTYHALVRGGLREAEFIIKRPIDGQTAITRARVLDSNRTASHLLIVIETGRTHQIRKHFAGIRHPVLGDHTYAAHSKASASEMIVPRQMLHAFQLRFKHPVNGRQIICEAPLPRDFRQCMKQNKLI